MIKQFIHNDISSTKIRLFIKRGMSIKYLLPDKVIEYMELNQLYKPVGESSVLASPMYRRARGN